MATNGNINHHDQYAAPAPTTEAPASADSQGPLPKVEVGWYFVEQYYTTMSKSPERLHVSLNASPILHWDGIDRIGSCSMARRHSSFAAARLRLPTFHSADM